MTADGHRIERLRIQSLKSDIERLPGDSATATPRALVQVYNGGSIPTATGKIFLSHPAGVDGAEAEAGSGSIVADPGRTIPVVVIGSRVPAAGNALVALSVGGRWVAESGAAPATMPCWPCPIPRKDLTVSWVNPVQGNGSATLAFTPPGQWESACVSGLQFRLACSSSVTHFGVSYFVSGDCPSGLRQECSNLASPPFALVLASSSCEPFYLNFTLSSAGCPYVAVIGYESFTITE